MSVIAKRLQNLLLNDAVPSDDLESLVWDGAATPYLDALAELANSSAARAVINADAGALALITASPHAFAAYRPPAYFANPNLRATGTTQNTNTDGKLNFTGASDSLASALNTSTDVFTAPATAVYSFIVATIASNTNDVALYVNGSLLAQFGQQRVASGVSCNFSIHVPLVAGDTVEIRHGTASGVSISAILYVVQLPQSARVLGATGAHTTGTNGVFKPASAWSVPSELALTGYDSTTGVFTAPAAGTYTIGLGTKMGNTSAAVLRKNGSIVPAGPGGVFESLYTQLSSVFIDGSLTLPLALGDTVEARISTGSSGTAVSVCLLNIVQH